MKPQNEQLQYCTDGFSVEKFSAQSSMSWLKVIGDQSGLSDSIVAPQVYEVSISIYRLYICVCVVSFSMGELTFLTIATTWRDPLPRPAFCRVRQNQMWTQPQLRSVEQRHWYPLWRIAVATRRSAGHSAQSRWTYQCNHPVLPLCSLR